MLYIFVDLKPLSHYIYFFIQNETDMKQFVIATLVGALIVFILQAMSWMVLPIHQDSLRYTPMQDSLLSAMSSLPGEGVYSLPYPDPAKADDPAEQKKFEESMTTRPWALVQYHPTGQDMTGGTIARGFLFNLLGVGLVVWLLGLAQSQLPTFTSRFLAVLAFGAFIVLQSDLMTWNWMGTPWNYLKGEILDHLLGWAVCGVWLGWYMGRR